MLRGIIDSEKLIAEVKIRPALYDGRNSDANVRKLCWEEIAKEMLPEVWDTSNNGEREALVKELQVKWKGFRDSYTRQRKLDREDQRKNVTKPRKKYVFYEQLTFLEAVCRSLQGSSTGAFQDVDQVQGDNSMSLDNTFNASDGSGVFKTDQDMYNEEDPIDTEFQVVGPFPEENNVAEVLKELVKIQKAEKTDDRMGNRKFLLSMLPFMERLPDDVNLEVRLQLMSVLHTYSNGESFMKA